MNVLRTKAVLLHQILNQAKHGLFLHGCAGVGRSARKIVQASYVTDSDGVLVVTFAMGALLADMSAFVDCTIL